MIKIGIEIIHAKSTEQKRTCYRVRYDVFIKETGYIQIKNEDELESDGYDELETTHHFLAYCDGVPAATARLVLPNKNIPGKEATCFGLPIEDLFDIKYYKTNGLRIGEISRSSVKLRYRSTKTIFYLWKELIDFAADRGITDLVTNVNPETDKLCDAYLIHQHVKSQNLTDKDIVVHPKKPGIGKTRSFRFPLFKSGCCGQENNACGGGDFELPQTLKLFTRVGIMFTGEPMYCEKIDMCAMPMNWRLKDIEKTPFGRFFTKRESMPKVA